jgi:hypothetical protein
MYIKSKVYGLPKPLRRGWKTSSTKTEETKYIYLVKIKGFRYYKVHLKRQGLSKIKYFKTMNQALVFVEFLRLNPYL